MNTDAKKIVDRFAAMMRIATIETPAVLRDAAREIETTPDWQSDVERKAVHAFVAVLRDSADRKEEILIAAFGSK